MIIIKGKMEKLLEQKKESLCEHNKESQKNNEKELLKEIIELYLKNKNNFTNKCSNTFIHEFGHLYEAILNNFKFTFIAIIDKENNYHHLFYKKKQHIEYVKIKRNPIKNINGVAWFYTPTELSVDNWINAALGGLKNDLSLNNKTLSESLDAFGFKIDKMCFVTDLLKKIKLKERKNSDLDLIIKCSSDKSYMKNLNDDFCAINNYLYDTSEDIILPSNKTAKKFPLAEYKKIIQES